MAIRLVIFDCDGTLVDSQRLIFDAMRATLSEAGITEPEIDRVKRVIGLSLPVAIQTLLPDAPPARCDELAERYKAHFTQLRQAGAFHEPPYPGIVALLAELEARGVLLGIATGKSRRGLSQVLDHQGWTARFVTTQTADDAPSKPHPAMLEQALTATGMRAREAMFVGDSIYDMQMAVEIGMRGIGVSWGYTPPDELRAHGADAIIETAQQLLDWLE